MSLFDMGDDPVSSAPASGEANSNPSGSDPFGDDPFGISDGADPFDPFSSPAVDQTTKSSESGGAAFDDFDPFSGPLLSPTSAAAASASDEQTTKSPSNNPFDDDPFSTNPFTGQQQHQQTTWDSGNSDALGGANTDATLDPFGLSSSADTKMADQDSAKAANLEQQFDDLLGGFGDAREVNGEVVVMESHEESHDMSDEQYEGGLPMDSQGRIKVVPYDVPEWAGVSIPTCLTPVPEEEGEREGSPGPGYSDSAKKVTDKKDLKAMDYMKARYEGGSQEAGQQQQVKIIRQPKKLEHTWGKEGEEKDVEGAEAQKKLPTEQDLLKYTSVGVNYQKQQYQDKSSRSLGETPPCRSPNSPSRWNNQNSPRHIPPPVNRAIVEKVAPPEITQSLRAKFEKGNFEDEHRPKKSVINLKEATDGGIYENEPQQLEGVIREADMSMDEQQAVLESGHTRKLLTQWSTTPGDEVKVRAPINLAEDEGKVLENEPEVRTDVCRESDQTNNELVLTKGSAKSLRERFNNYQEAPKKKKVPTATLR